MMKWFASKHCVSRAHCTACRGSAAFRRSIVRSELIHQQDFDCPHGITLDSIPEPRNLVNDLWSEFHRAALADALTADSMEDFNLRVDLLNVCQCGQHWREILAAAPALPAADQFAWSVARHNDVNARLGKPLLTLEEARAIYQ